MSMKTVLLRVGTLLAAVAGGCASVGSTAVPVQPVSGGTRVDLSSYDLQVNGQVGGRVLLAGGQAVRESGDRRLVHIGMTVENKTGDETYRVPTGEIFLTSLADQPIPLVEIDRGVVPETIEVAPGQSRSLDLAFALPPDKRIDDVHAFQVHWSLLVDGAQAPIERTTAFNAAVRQPHYPSTSVM